MTRPLCTALCALLLAALPATAAQPGDGSRDFDFNFGTWHTHIKRLTKPLTGSPDFILLDGTVTVRKVWNGGGQIEEFEVDGPNNLHVQGMTVFLYNPTSRQWSQTWVNSKEGVLDTPLIGSFKDGRGELIAQETVDGRAVLVRGVWSDIKPDSHHFEEDYSDDGGKSWEAVFSADLTRVKS